MIWNILLVIIAIAWIILYIKNKKTIISLPYLSMIFITPIYNILDQKVFVNIFGCGCVPTVQTNMFNIDFNANDLRAIVYNIIWVVNTIIGIILAKKLQTRKAKIIYVISILLINLFLAWKICKLYLWN